MFLRDDPSAGYDLACVHKCSYLRVWEKRLTVRQAKSIFSRWAMEYYENKIKLPPTIESFRRAGASVKPRKYMTPPQELRIRTFEEAKSLKKEQPDLYGVFLLCYDLGMRGGEAAAARWDWIESREVDGQTQREIKICRRSDWRGPKNLVAHRVPIGDQTWAL